MTTELLPGWKMMFDAPKDLLGKTVRLMHWSGVTEVCSLDTKEQAATAIKRGWTRYREVESIEVTQ